MTLRDYMLIVEDDEDVRDNLATLLKLKGHDVETAEHGQDALVKLSQEGPPCMIILDLMMPVMNGWELRKALRSDPAFADVPVVLFSGVADVGEAARALDAVDHLRKPIDFKKLFELVEQHC